MHIDTARAVIIILPMNDAAKTAMVDAVEGISTGISFDGATYTALTLTESADFKTRTGAARWLERRGYKADGTKAR